MKCEQIQPNLLDYAEGRLSRPESDEVRAHIAECSECAAMLEDEKAFSQRLSSIPAQHPTTDVWAMIHAQTKPRRVGLLVTLGDAMRSYHKAAAAMVAAMLILLALYNLMPAPTSTERNIQPTQAQTVQVKWSDDPMGTQTDAMINYVDNM